MSDDGRHLTADDRVIEPDADVRDLVHLDGGRHVGVTLQDERDQPTDLPFVVYDETPWRHGCAPR